MKLLIGILGLLIGLSPFLHGVGTANSQSHALLNAVRQGNATRVGALLKTPGIDVNALDESGTTALLEAARNGDQEVARNLVRAGANVDVRDRNGKTALALAQQGGYDGVIRVLKQGGATE